MWAMFTVLQCRMQVFEHMKALTDTHVDYNTKMTSIHGIEASVVSIKKLSSSVMSIILGLILSLVFSGGCCSGD